MTLEELGALLRAERERRGLSIEDVSAHLKISVRKLRALEDGDELVVPQGIIDGAGGIEADPQFIAFVFPKGDVFPSLVEYDVKVKGAPIEDGLDSPILVSHKAVFA